MNDEQQKWRDLIPMIEVESGTFDMGNPNRMSEADAQATPVHQVTSRNAKDPSQRSRLNGMRIVTNK